MTPDQSLPRENSAALTSACSLERWQPQGGFVFGHDRLAREEPLEIRIQGRGIAVTMRTPGHDRELAAGFLLGEGIVRRTEDILEIAPCPYGEAGREENVLNVFLAEGVSVNFPRLTRHVYASSSCGLCGKASIEAVQQNFAAVTSTARTPAAVLLQLPEVLRAAQPAFGMTGGLHAAALFDLAGELITAREDVGRHNAVDKVLGAALLGGLVPLTAHVLLVSGRSSFEIMQKALSAQIPILAAVSAPSSLAVEFAKESGQTLVGFLRSGGMNIYSGAQRIEG